MKTNRQKNRGFSLIEVLAVLLLVGVFVAFTGLLFGPVVQTFINARRATEIMHDSQLAMARISRELTTVTNVVSGSSLSITYDTLDSSGISHRRNIAWSGTPGSALLLNGNTLIDDLQQFSFSYLNNVGSPRQSSWGIDSTIIEVFMDIGIAGSSYTNRFYPRNIR